MPMYEYDCPSCGDFTTLHPMAESGLACGCPVSGNQRRAIETNEHSANAPKTVAEYQDSKRHPSGCSCCGPSKTVVPTKANPLALKGKAAGRPWMISH